MVEAGNIAGAIKNHIYLRNIKKGAELKIACMNINNQRWGRAKMG